MYRITTGVLLAMIIGISSAAPETGLGEMDGLLHSIARRSVDRCTKGCHHPHGRGNLQVNVSYGWGFPNTDFLWGKPDPYVIVKAIKEGHIENRMQTNYKKNTRDPHWNEILSFGCGYWESIKISVKDRDKRGDDELLGEKTFVICEEDEPVCLEEYGIKDKGAIKFEIRYTADRNECYPNPCYNGGICKELACSQYQCVCPSGFTGKNCERKSHYGGGGGGGGSPGDGPQLIDVNGGILSNDGGSDGFFNNY